MKKCICFVLVLALLVTTVAFAADTLSFSSKTGKYAPTIKTKTSATGSSGSVTASSNAGGHSMYYQIHKANGGAATVYKNTSGTGTYTLDTVDKSVVLWYNEEKRTGVFFHGEQLSTARYVRCDVGNSQAVHNRKQGNVGRERKGYPSISEWRVLDFENGSTMERPAAGIW